MMVPSKNQGGERMAKFKASAYKEKLKKSTKIGDCEKVPVPRGRKDGKYIFISYSHKDYKKVYADLAELYEKGIPFWYDRGLPAGKNWDDVVREKMNDPRCSGVIFYLSESLFLSQSIQTEIRIARGEDGDMDMPRLPLTYFSVNLTDMCPSELLDKVYADKRFTDVADRMSAKRSWQSTLADAFPDKATYLPYDDKTHLQDMLEQVNLCFGLSSNVNPYDFGGAKFVSGAGVIEFDNGSRYDGSFRDGLFEGQGILTLRSGSVYAGNWEKGKQQGQGSYTWPDGAKYVGQWTEGNRTGQGVMTYPDGAKYEGHWKENKRQGQGVIVYANGITYDGQWKHGEEHGHGIIVFSNGVKYDGQMKSGKCHGQGIMTFSDGSSYEGQWKNDKWHGQGILILSSGSKYVGQLNNDYMHGQGTYYYPDGASRTGIWEADILLEGSGVLRYEDGSWYDGEIRSNLRHGKGRLTQADGTVLEGLFENDKFIGA